MKHLAIFASGSGSNAENLVLYFKDHSHIKCCLLLCDNKDAYVFERMKQHNIPSYLISKNSLVNEEVTSLLKKYKIDYIILAGFLKLIPPSLIKLYNNKIINIHPSLLPKFGGKGMYGMHIHEAVVKANETETGITIHYVNENFDEGEVIVQHKTSIDKKDTPPDVAKKISELEMKWFPVEIEKLLSSE